MKLQSLLALAKLPPDNPPDWAALDTLAHYMLTLIGHDYPGKTPAMWNAVYRRYNLPYVAAMMLGRSADLAAIVAALKADPKYIGGGVGVGFKDQILDFIDELDPLAAAIGAVNLIQKLPNGRLKGWNTDGRGYVESLDEIGRRQGLSLAGAKVVMLGAGGTGNAIAFALADRGANLVIVNRTVTKAEALAERVNAYAGRALARGCGEEVLAQEIPTAMVVINVSTKGAAGELEQYSALGPATLPATAANLAANREVAETLLTLMPKTAIISDVVLRDGPTPFLAAADRHGFVTLDGLPMVINQGVVAFLIIHGRELRPEDEEVLRQEMTKAPSRS